MPILARPSVVRIVAEGLDHPECVSFGPDGLLYAGGEAGQVYRIRPASGEVQEMARTGGFHLGLAVDGEGNVWAADVKNRELRRFEPDGRHDTASRGTPDRRMEAPNACVFDRTGNLYVSDSGDYWSSEGTGCIYVVRPSGLTEMFHPGPLCFPNGLAIDPAHEYLYIIESTAPRIIRIPLPGSGPAQGRAEVVVEMECCVPDGLAFDRAGRLYIGCYKPDAVYRLDEGRLDTLVEDPCGELLSRPTNVAIQGGELYMANLGGWHIGAVQIDAEAGPMYHPARGGRAV